MRKSLLFSLAVVGALLSCDDSPPPVTGPDPGLPPIPQGFYALQKISGDGQTGAPGEPLADPYVVKVVDSFGGAVPEALVRFRIENDSGGSLSSSSTLSDSAGDAWVRARLPDQSGAVQTVIAFMDSSRNILSFRSTTTQVLTGAANIAIVSGDAQTGAARDTLLFPLVVEVTNSDGVSLPGVSVKWRILSAAGGSIEVSPTVTDSLGLAENRWRLGGIPGAVDTLIAWVEPSGAPPDTVYFTADVTGGAAVIRIVSGDGQKGIERDTLLDALVVEVRDSAGVAVEGVSVKWQALGLDGGALRETPTITDAEGLAYNRWRIGNEPGDTVRAIAWIEPPNALPDTVEFWAQVTGIPDRIVIDQGAIELDFEYSEPDSIAGDTVMVAPGHWARLPFKGKVLDADSTEVRGAILTWTVTNRGGQVGLEPEDGVGEEAVTLNTAEDGAITVWRRACDDPPNTAVCSTDGNWIGATLSIEKYPNVVPVTLNALIRESAAP